MFPLYLTSLSVLVRTSNPFSRPTQPFLIELYGLLFFRHGRAQYTNYCTPCILHERHPLIPTPSKSSVATTAQGLLTPASNQLCQDAREDHVCARILMTERCLRFRSFVLPILPSVPTMKALPLTPFSHSNEFACSSPYRELIPIIQMYSTSK